MNNRINVTTMSNALSQLLRMMALLRRAGGKASSDGLRKASRGVSLDSSVVDDPAIRGMDG